MADQDVTSGFPNETTLADRYEAGVERAEVRAPWFERVSAFLRHKYRLPEGWQGFKFEAIEPLRKSPGVLVTGAVTPPKRRGKHAGQPNWRAKDKATQKTLLLLNAEFEAWDQPHLYAALPTPEPSHD